MRGAKRRVSKTLILILMRFLDELRHKTCGNDNCLSILESVHSQMEFIHECLWYLNQYLINQSHISNNIRLALSMNYRLLQQSKVIYYLHFQVLKGKPIVIDLLLPLRKSWDQHYRIDLTAMWYIGVAGSSVCIVLVLFSTLNIIMAHICPEGNHRLHKSNHSVYCMQYACQ